MEANHRITEAMVVQSVAVEAKVEPRRVSVKSFEVTEGNKKGENFSCILKAVNGVARIEGNEDLFNFEYIVKCLPQNEFRLKLLQDMRIFETEVRLYEDILPALIRFTGGEISVPDTFYGDSDSGVLFMENLRRKGYFMVDKSVGLDMSEIKLVLTQLAEFHASSYHYLQNYEGGVEQFMRDFPILNISTYVNYPTQELKDISSNMTKQNQELFADCIRELTDDQDLIQRVVKFGDNRQERTDAVHPAKDGAFNCLIHNDAWCNNFLFTTEGAEKVSKMLDFQVVRRARPAIDLAYFFCSSTTTEFRKRHLDELLRFYYDLLNAELTRLGHDAESVFPFSRLISDFDECFIFGYGKGQMHAMLALTPKKGDEDFYDFTDVKDPKEIEEMSKKVRVAQIKLAKSNPELGKRLLDLAIEAAERGII